MRRESLDEVHRVSVEVAGCFATHYQQADDIFPTKERRHQSRAIPGAQDDFVDRVGRLLPQVGDLDRLALRKRSANVRLVKADVAVRQRVDQFLIHAVGGAQVKFALHVVEDVDRAGFGAGELHRLGDDGREHSLKIECRVHGLGDFAKRAQLPDRAAKLVGSLAQLVE